MKKDVLRKIDYNIQNGDYGKARDRLHTLISIYPNDLSLRKQLGDLYNTLHYPAMAGRYWYLEENKTEEMLKACIAFEKACGENKYAILSQIKFKGKLEEIPPYAREKLLTLRKESKIKYKFYCELHPEKVSVTERVKGIAETFRVFCGILVIISIFLIFLVGLISIVLFFIS